MALYDRPIVSASYTPLFWYEGDEERINVQYQKDIKELLKRKFPEKNDAQINCMYHNEYYDFNDILSSHDRIEREEDKERIMSIMEHQKNELLKQVTKQENKIIKDIIKKDKQKKKNKRETKNFLEDILSTQYTLYDELVIKGMVKPHEFHQIKDFFSFNFKVKFPGGIMMSKITKLTDIIRYVNLVELNGSEENMKLFFEDSNIYRNDHFTRKITILGHAYGLHRNFFDVEDKKEDVQDTKPILYNFTAFIPNKNKDPKVRKYTIQMKTYIISSIMHQILNINIPFVELYGRYIDCHASYNEDNSNQNYYGTGPEYKYGGERNIIYGYQLIRYFQLFFSLCALFPNDMDINIILKIVNMTIYSEINDLRGSNNRCINNIQVLMDNNITMMHIEKFTKQLYIFYNQKKQYLNKFIHTPAKNRCNAKPFIRLVTVNKNKDQCESMGQISFLSIEREIHFILSVKEEYLLEISKRTKKDNINIQKEYCNSDYTFDFDYSTTYSNEEKKDDEVEPKKNCKRRQHNNHKKFLTQIHHYAKKINEINNYMFELYDNYVEYYKVMFNLRPSQISLMINHREIIYYENFKRNILYNDYLILFDYIKPIWSKYSGKTYELSPKVMREDDILKKISFRQDERYGIKNKKIKNCNSIDTLFTALKKFSNKVDQAYSRADNYIEETGLDFLL